MENPIKMDDLGGFPIFLETPKYTPTLSPLLQSAIIQPTTPMIIIAMQTCIFFASSGCNIGNQRGFHTQRAMLRPGVVSSCNFGSFCLSLPGGKGQVVA